MPVILPEIVIQINEFSRRKHEHSVGL